jgi:hypothetical protein
LSRLPGKRARPVLRGPRRSNAPGLPVEHAGDASPDGMQHLLARAVWDHDKVRDNIGDDLLEAEPYARLENDDTHGNGSRS